MNYAYYQCSPSPSFEISEEMQPMNETYENIMRVATVSIRIIINSNIVITNTFQVSSCFKGISITSLYLAMSNYQYCNHSSIFTLYGNRKIVEWKPTMPDIYIIPFVWLDGTEFLEAHIVNEVKPIEAEEVNDTTAESIYAPELNKSTRSRERRISEVSAKLDEWKQLCIRLKESTPEVKKISERAADIVGIPKKSLDDYMHQIKLGLKYNFDFSKNQDGKIGKLRQFNKREGSRHKRSHRKSM